MLCRDGRRGLLIAARRGRKDATQGEHGNRGEDCRALRGTRELQPSPAGRRGAHRRAIPHGPRLPKYSGHTANSPDPRCSPGDTLPPTTGQDPGHRDLDRSGRVREPSRAANGFQIGLTGGNWTGLLGTLQTSKQRGRCITDNEFCWRGGDQMCVSLAGKSM